MSNNIQIELDLARIRKHGIFLMAPCYGGQCFAAFAKSAMELAALCALYQIPFKTHFIFNESLVQRARNYAADEFLRASFQYKVDEEILEKPYDLGVFIDSDVEFSAQDVLVLAHYASQDGYDVVCGPYPKKRISWEKIVGAVNKGAADEDSNELENYVGDYVFNLPPGTTKISLSEPAEVLESGTGFMMFHRRTLERFKEAYPGQEYTPDHITTKNFDGSRKIHAFFDCIIDPETNRYLSEDYYFCQYIRKAGMKIWVLPWIRLKHHGYYSFGGSLAALASVGAVATADVSKLKK